MMITIYTTAWCGYCIMAKRFLSRQGLEFREVDIEKQGISREDLRHIAGGWTVPQIIVDGRSIGGYDNLVALHDSGGLFPK